MRKRKRGRKFARQRDQRKAFVSGLARNLLLRERIETTLPRAKEARIVIERAITVGKKGDLAARRRLAVRFSDRVAKKIVSDIAPRYTARPGGYTRIRKLGSRRGDAAPRAIIELV